MSHSKVANTTTTENDYDKVVCEYGKSCVFECPALKQHPQWLNLVKDGKSVFSYIFENGEPHIQDTLFKNRMTFSPSQTPDRMSSFLLKNVTSRDAGRYNLHSFNRKTREQVFSFSVSVQENDNQQWGANMNRSHPAPTDTSGGDYLGFRIGLIVGLGLGVVILGLIVAGLTKKMWKGKKFNRLEVVQEDRLTDYLGP